MREDYTPTPGWKAEEEIIKPRFGSSSPKDGGHRGSFINLPLYSKSTSGQDVKDSTEAEPNTSIYYPSSTGDLIPTESGAHLFSLQKLSTVQTGEIPSEPYRPSGSDKLQSLTKALL